MAKTSFALVVSAALLLSSEASAQVSFIEPDGSGGYSVVTPGRAPAFVYRNGGGGYTVVRPGGDLTFANPNGMGGFTVVRPYAGGGVPWGVPAVRRPSGWR